MQRFYFDMLLTKHLSISDKEFFHQISHVLRCRLWDEVILFNGDGWDYTYAITEITKKAIILIEQARINVMSDPLLPMHLYQAMPNKFEKIEYIIQKGVEVGIAKFIFFRSDRSQKLIISESKKERFRAIAQEALEQSGWNRFPEMAFVEHIDFEHIPGKALLFHTIAEESVSLRNLAQTIFPTGKLPGSVSLFVWPEWGFSDTEVAMARESGVEMVHFGPRTLRTETVSSVVVFYLQQLI